MNLTKNNIPNNINYETSTLYNYQIDERKINLSILKHLNINNEKNPIIDNINTTKNKLLMDIIDIDNETIFNFNNSNIIINKFDNKSYNEPDSIFYFYGTIPLIFFCILSIAINIKILLSIYWIRKPLSPTLYISLSLTGADAFSSFVLGVGLFMNSLLPHGLGLKLRGVDCFLLGLEAVRLGAVMVTVGHLVTLAVNHYLGIMKPLHYLSIMTRRTTTFIVIILWTVPLCFFITYFSLVEGQGFQSKNCNETRFLNNKKFRVMFSSLFFGPFVLMVCIYTHIFFIVRKHQALRLRFSQIGSSFRSNENCARVNNSFQQMAKNVKAIHTTLYILGSFVIGWMPATILFVLVCKDCLLKFNGLSANMIFIIYFIANFLIILKTLINPIIYAARMHEIKIATRRMHSSLCGYFCFSNFSRDKSTDGLSSDGLNRASLTRTRVYRLNSNISNKYQRDKNCKYSYTGFKKPKQNNTIV